jgi:hypothetical protein
VGRLYGFGLLGNIEYELPALRAKPSHEHGRASFFAQQQAGRCFLKILFVTFGD